MAGIQRDFRQCSKILRKNGFNKVRQTGGHSVFKRNGDEIVLQQKPNAMQFQRIIREFSLVV